MAHADTAVHRELKLLGVELKLLGTSAMIAMQGRNETALDHIIDRRSEVLARVHAVAASNSDAVRKCVELNEAAEQEAQLLAVAQPRRDELRDEMQSVQQRLALRRAYGE